VTTRSPSAETGSVPTICPDTRGPAPGSARSSASTSSSVKRLRVGGPPKSPSPGRTNSRFEPSPSTTPVISARAPCPIETSSTTDMTPMTTPRVVRNERSRFATIAWSATRSASRGLTSRSPCRDDEAVAQLDAAPGARGDLRFVGDDHERHAPLALDALEERHDLLAGRRVEVAGRLVGEQQGRFGDERTGDRDALLLPAGELRRTVIHPVAEPDRLEGRPRTGPALLR
jgi:hypothetical protein